MSDKTPLEQTINNSNSIKQSSLSPASHNLLKDQSVQVVYNAQQQVVNGYCFPLIIKASEQLKTDQKACFKWLAEFGDDLRLALQDHGAIYFKDFPLLGATDFEKALDEAKFKEMPYVGGAAPREVVTSRRILTANESPADQPIPFHHEMAQTPNPPGYVFFYCETAAQSGGATPIVHSHQVYQRFSEINPEFAKRFEEHGAKYVRIMPAIDDPNSPIGRSWKSTFQVQSQNKDTAKLEAEQAMKKLGTSWRWLEDGNLYTESASVPAIRLEPRTQMKTFFNSAVAAYTGWVDERNDPTKAVKCGDDTAVDGSALLATAEAMKDLKVALKWEKGDMMWIDNHLTMHSREPYQGERRILAAISPQ